MDLSFSFYFTRNASSAFLLRLSVDFWFYLDQPNFLLTKASDKPDRKSIFHGWKLFIIYFRCFSDRKKGQKKVIIRLIKILLPLGTVSIGLARNLYINLMTFDSIQFNIQLKFHMRNMQFARGAMNMSI